MKTPMGSLGRSEISAVSLACLGGRGTSLLSCLGSSQPRPAISPVLCALGNPPLRLPCTSVDKAFWPCMTLFDRFTLPGMK